MTQNPSFTTFKDRVRAARRLRRYSSAEKAGRSIGLPGGSYTVHERGIGIVTTTVVRKIAQGFGISEEFLLEGREITDSDRAASEFLWMSDKDFRIFLRAERATVGRRLREVRKSAGFETALDATRHYGWPPGTYYGHENARRIMSSKDEMVYAFAYGVSVEELREERHSTRKNSGFLPSPEEVREFSIALSRERRPPEIVWIPVYEDAKSLLASIDPASTVPVAPVDVLPITRALVASYSVVAEDDIVILRVPGADAAPLHFLLRRRTWHVGDHPRCIVLNSFGDGSVIDVAPGDLQQAVPGRSLPIIAVVGASTVLKEGPFAVRSDISRRPEHP